MTLSPELAWVSPLDWNDDPDVILFAKVILDRQEYAAGHQIAWLDEISSATIEDLNDQIRSQPQGDWDNGPRELRAMLFLRFLVSIIPMTVALGHGRRGQAFDWGFRGIATDYDAGRRHNSGFTYLPLLRTEGDPRIAALAMRWLPRWTRTFFLMARDMSLESEAASTFALGCWSELRGLGEVNGTDDPQLLTEVYGAFAAIASWAVKEDSEHLTDWIRTLVDDWRSGIIPAPGRPAVATVFITRASRLTGRSVRDWAEEVLDQYGASLREHERLASIIS